MNLGFLAYSSIWQESIRFGSPFPTPICCVFPLKEEILDISQSSIDKLSVYHKVIYPIRLLLTSSLEGINNEMPKMPN
jgi:hypothetical protein